jgi:hypothetical protein
MTDTGGPCRFCGAELVHVFADLGMSPLCNSMIRAEELNEMEPFYPLCTYVCERCFLVQLREYVSPAGIFTDYTYFSSYSDSWLDHVRRYTEMARKRFRLDQHSQVVEIASNDGYLLQYFVEAGIPSLGIEPAANVAQVALEKGIPTLVKFFGQQTARELAALGRNADLIVGNNVLAHVPDVNDFVGGLATLLKADGVITMEFPHLMRLMADHQFDTIYHEHFSYYSFLAVRAIFAAHGLTLFDVEELPTHGGSLRIYARHTANDSADKAMSSRASGLEAREVEAGFRSLSTYSAFGGQVKETKRKLLEFVIGAKREGKTLAGYGAPGKGNTLLNYCGIGRDFIDFTVDRNPYKQGRYLPGTHIPVHHPDRIREVRPDYVLILPWNLKDEIVEQVAYIAEWGGRFVVPIPEVEVFAPPAAPRSVRPDCGGASSSGAAGTGEGARMAAAAGREEAAPRTGAPKDALVDDTADGEPDKGHARQVASAAPARARLRFVRKAMVLLAFVMIVVLASLGVVLGQRRPRVPGPTSGSGKEPSHRSSVSDTRPSSTRRTTGGQVQSQTERLAA